MPAFVKNPKFIIGTIVVLWVAYVIYGNFQIDMVTFYLLPFNILKLQLRLSAVIIGAAIFGALATIVIHWLGCGPRTVHRRRCVRAADAAAVAVDSEKQHRRLSAGLQQRFTRRTDQQTVGARDRAEDSRALVAGRRSR